MSEEGSYLKEDVGFGGVYRINIGLNKGLKSDYFIILPKKVVPGPARCRGLEPEEHESSLL